MTTEQYALDRIYNEVKNSIEDAEKRSKEYSDDTVSRLAYEVGMLRGAIKSVIMLVEIATNK